jgi:hypothetical protein
VAEKLIALEAELEEGRAVDMSLRAALVEAERAAAAAIAGLHHSEGPSSGFGTSETFLGPKRRQSLHKFALQHIPQRRTFILSMDIRIKN